MRMDLGMRNTLLYDFMHCMTVVSLEMSDEPKLSLYWNSRFEILNVSFIFRVSPKTQLQAYSLKHIIS